MLFETCLKINTINLNLVGVMHKLHKALPLVIKDPFTYGLAYTQSMLPIRIESTVTGAWVVNKL